MTISLRGAVDLITVQIHFNMICIENLCIRCSRCRAREFNFNYN